MRDVPPQTVVAGNLATVVQTLLSHAQDGIIPPSIAEAKRAMPAMA